MIPMRRCIYIDKTNLFFILLTIVLFASARRLWGQKVSFYAISSCFCCSDGSMQLALTQAIRRYYFFRDPPSTHLVLAWFWTGGEDAPCAMVTDKRAGTNDRALSLWSIYWSWEDYQSKHHTGGHHQAVRPWYLHEPSSPLVLPWASRPSTLKGCVGTLPQGYIRNVPLPRVPRGQSAKSHTQVIQYLGNGTRYPVTTIPDYYETPYVVPTYVSPRSLVESAAYAFSPAWHACWMPK